MCRRHGEPAQARPRPHDRLGCGAGKGGGESADYPELNIGAEHRGVRRKRLHLCLKGTARAQIEAARKSNAHMWLSQVDLWSRVGKKNRS